MVEQYMWIVYVSGIYAMLSIGLYANIRGIQVILDTVENEKWRRIVTDRKKTIKVTEAVVDPADNK